MRCARRGSQTAVFGQKISHLVSHYTECGGELKLNFEADSRALNENPVSPLWGVNELYIPNYITVQTSSGKTLLSLVTLASICLSLMMYSYVVSSTLNFPLRSCGTNPRRRPGVPLKLSKGRRVWAHAECTTTPRGRQKKINKKKLCLYLVCDFDHRGGPLVELVDPVGQSPAEKWRSRWQRAQRFICRAERSWLLTARQRRRGDTIPKKCLSWWAPLIYIKKEKQSGGRRAALFLDQKGLSSQWQSAPDNTDVTVHPPPPTAENKEAVHLIGCNFNFVGKVEQQLHRNDGWSHVTGWRSRHCFGRLGRPMWRNPAI